MGSSSKLTVLLAIAAAQRSAFAHIAMWHPSMYGWNPADGNQNDVCTPLMGMSFADWWFHGKMGTVPAAGQVLELPSGGTLHAEVSCNKAYTSYGPSYQLQEYACPLPMGAMHTQDEWGIAQPLDVKGCGIGIAYKSDITQVQPEDFTIISTNFTCPWTREVDFQIPANLPPCPEGGCTCMWGWVHSSSPSAGSTQMYMLGYRCDVTGATGKVPLPQAQVARKCPYDKTNCTVGSKQPHYWDNLEKNNNNQGYLDPPFYNADYGFQNGAQTDLFDALTTTAAYTQTAWAPQPTLQFTIATVADYIPWGATVPVVINSLTATGTSTPTPTATGTGVTTGTSLTTTATSSPSTTGPGGISVSVGVSVGINTLIDQGNVATATPTSISIPVAVQAGVGSIGKPATKGKGGKGKGGKGKGKGDKGKQAKPKADPKKMKGHRRLFENVITG